MWTRVAGALALAFTIDQGAIAFAQTDAGAAPPPEDLADIEKALAADQQAVAETRPAPAPSAVGALAQALSPDISFVTDVALAWFSTDEPMQAGGHDPNQNGFNLQQVEMAVSKSVDPYFRFDSFIVFSQFGVEVEEAVGTTLALPHSLQARIGQFLTRFGRINATHPHAWDFADQPFALGRVFGGEGNRGLGAELSWLSPLPWYLEVIASVTDPVGEATARSFFGPEDLPLETPLDFQTTAAVKQFFALSDDWSLLTGVSVATGPNPTGHDNRTDVYGADLYLTFRPISYGSHTIVSLQTEWLYRRRQVPADLLADLNGYAQLFWRFSQRWGTAARWDYGGPARGDGDAVDELDPDWVDHRHRGSASLTFWPTEFSRIRAQVSVDAPAWLDDPIWAGFLGFEFGVGAHGAHAF
jgi:hypothetical protein